MDTFNFIAVNMAVIYYVIKNSKFGKTLTPNQILYATALCDTASYLFSGKIDTDEIKEALFVSQASSVKIGFYSQSHNIFEYIPNRELVNLTLQIEAMIFTIDTNVDYHDIVDIVISKKDIISNQIEKTLNQGDTAPLYDTINKNISEIIKQKEFQELIYEYED